MLRPDFTSLRIFLSVYNAGNIARAAEREHIAPSAVSKRVQDLEADTGIPLFHRHARGVTPTAAGEALARHAHRLFEDVNSMSAELSAFSEGVRGDVRVHAHSSAVVQYLPQEIASFSRQYPQVRVVLREETSPNVITSIQDGVADIGIFASNMGCPPGLTLIPYRRDRLAVVLPCGHPLADLPEIGFSAIRDGDYISPETGSSLQILLDAAAKSMGFELKVRIEVKTFEAAIRMAEVGLGIAVVPAGIAANHTGGLKVVGVPLSDAWAHRNLVACIKNEARLTASARLMLRHLKASALESAAGTHPATMAAVPNG